MKIKPQYGLDVGFSNGGYVRLEQDNPNSVEDSIILLGPSEVIALHTALSKLLDGDWWVATEDEEVAG